MSDRCTVLSDVLRQCAKVGDRANDRGCVHAPGRSRLRVHSQVIRVTPWNEDIMGDHRQDARFDARTPDRLCARGQERRIYAARDAHGEPVVARARAIELWHQSSESRSHGEAFGPGAQYCCAECANTAIGGTSLPFVSHAADHGSERTC